MGLCRVEGLGLLGFKGSVESLGVLGLGIKTQFLVYD